MDFSYVLDSRFRGNDTADPSIRLKCYVNEAVPKWVAQRRPRTVSQPF